MRLSGQFRQIGVAVSQPVLQPLAEEAVELQLLVGLVHAGIGVAVATMEVALALEVGDLGHAHVYTVWQCQSFDECFFKL